MSAGENDVWREVSDEDGDCLLRTLDRSFRRIRRGISDGIDGRHENGNFALEYVSWNPLREENVDFFIAQRAAAAEPVWAKQEGPLEQLHTTTLR